MHPSLRCLPRLSLLVVMVASASCAASHPSLDADDAGLARPDGPDALPLVLDAPDGGEPIEDPTCDDLDPCTLDTRVGGACAPRPMPDGTLCDDGDSCTLGDRCIAGACVAGPRSTGPAEVVSLTQPAFRGAAVGVGGDRFVFFPSGREAVLARASGDGLERIDGVPVGVGVQRAYSLGDGLVAFVSGAHFGLLEVEGDRLVAHPMQSTGPQEPHHFAHTPERLWVCIAGLFGPTSLLELDASDLDALSTLHAIDIPGGCQSVRPSSDGLHVYVSNQTDTLVVAPGGVVARSLGVPSFAGHVRDGLLTLTGSGGVVVLRESDGAELGRLEARGVTGARTTARGLEVFSDAPRDGGTDRVLSVYQLAGGGLTLTHEEVFLRYATARTAPGAWRWASHDDALLEGMRVFSLTASAPPLVREIRDSERFWPYWLRAEGSTLFLRDDVSAIAVDISDPAAPRALAGGELTAPLRPAVEVPRSGEIGLYGLREWWPLVSGHAPHAIAAARVPRMQLVGRSYDAAELPTDHLVRELPDASVVMSTYRNVYAIDTGAEAEVRLRRWPAAAFFVGDFTPGLDHTFASPDGARVTAAARLRTDEAFAFATEAGPGSARIHWAALSEPETLASIDVDFSVHQMVVHGDRVFVIGFHPDPALPTSGFVSSIVLATLERAGDALVVLDTSEREMPRFHLHSGTSPLAILRFDRRVAYLQLPFSSPTDPRPAVVAIDAERTEEQVVYPLASSEPLWSATDSDVGLVFSGPGGVTIARPWCR